VPPLTKELQVGIYRRDGWICRWCSRPVVFAPALKYLERVVRDRGHVGPLAYHHPQWRRDLAPLLDHLGAVIDHVEAFSRGGAHDATNFVTSCNKCNIRKNNAKVDDFTAKSPHLAVKGKYGEPAHWDGLSSLFIVMAQSESSLPASERGWLKALTFKAPT
jgi:5-methylcytosine-specific restriction endonuclease McrA